MNAKIGNRGRIPEGANGLSGAGVVRFFRHGTERPPRVLPYARRRLKGARSPRVSGGECGKRKEEKEEEEWRYIFLVLVLALAVVVVVVFFFFFTERRDFCRVTGVLGKRYSRREREKGRRCSSNFHVLLRLSGCFMAATGGIRSRLSRGVTTAVVPSIFMVFSFVGGRRRVSMKSVLFTSFILLPPLPHPPLLLPRSHWLPGCRPARLPGCPSACLSVCPSSFMLAFSLLQFFRMLHSPESMHPQSRYPDGNVTTVVGAGLDELMRHVPSLRPQCIKALVASLKEVQYCYGCTWKK